MAEWQIESRSASKFAQPARRLKKTQKQMAEQNWFVNKSTLSLIWKRPFHWFRLDILERYLDRGRLTLEVTPKKHQITQWDEIESLFCGGMTLMSRWHWVYCFPP